MKHTHPSNQVPPTYFGATPLFSISQSSYKLGSCMIQLQNMSSRMQDLLLREAITTQLLMQLGTILRTK